MKKLLFALSCVPVLFLAAIAFADKTVVLSSATARVTAVTCVPLADGGVSATVTASASAADGGFYFERTTPFEDLTGAARTTCLNAVTAGTTAWKNNEGL